MPASPGIVERLEQHSCRDPERQALAWSGGSWTWRELLDRADSCAQVLSTQGIDARSVVGVHGADDREHLVVTLALERVGAASIALPGGAATEELEALEVGAGVTHRVGPGAAVERVAPAAGAASPAARLLFCTSGTTGAPKVVVHSSAGLVAQAHRHVGVDERFACRAPMEHNFVRRHRLYCVAEGATNVLLPTRDEELVEAALGTGLTTLHLSAYQAQELLCAPAVASLGGLRLKLGGSHVSAALRERLRAEITRELHCGYGTTETGAISFTDPADGDSDGSVGRPLPGLEVRVIDANGAALPGGERGELLIRGDGLFEAYLGRPDLYAERLRDGWFHTGDLVSIDAAGRLHVGGRADDTFVFNSLNIVPQDLEAQLRAHPGVADVVVVPRPSPVHGDVPVALVVPNGTPDLADLKRFARRTAGLRAPRRFTLVDQVPRNAAGKVLRCAARELMEAAQG